MTRPHSPHEIARLLTTIASRMENADSASELSRYHEEIINVLILMSETEAAMANGEKVGLI